MELESQVFFYRSKRLVKRSFLREASERSERQRNRFVQKQKSVQRFAREASEGSNQKLLSKLVRQKADAAVRTLSFAKSQTDERSSFGSICVLPFCRP